MGGVSVDHIVALIVFVSAIMLFVGFFGQTIQTGIIYQQNQAVATKCSDLLDSILLNPGSPNNWGQENSTLSSFGIQDPEFTQYQLSAFSLMRLGSTGNLAEFDKTSQSIYYNSLTLGLGSFLLTPNAQAVNYSTVLSLLGINGTYGFQLSLTPDISVSITENQASSPLILGISATGTGFPLAYATVSYCFVQVTLPSTDAQYPSYTIQNGTVTTDQTGAANVQFPSVTNPNQVYSFIAYAHSNGIVGVGYHAKASNSDQYIVPILQDFASQNVALAHNYDLNNSNPATLTLKYNATFVILKQDYTLSELSLSSPGDTGVNGTVTSGYNNPFPSISLPEYSTGILIVTYQQQDNLNQGGVVMMPWGVGSLAVPITFGGNPAKQQWVATDLRQVMINNVAYQAKLSLWSTQGMQVKS